MTMKKTQEQTEFQPSEEQLVFADAYVLSYANVSEAFRRIGRDRQKYYVHWRHQEGFEEWLSEYCKNNVLKRRGQWFSWLEKYARAGSHKHLVTLLEIAKEFTPAPQMQNNYITYVYTTEPTKAGQELGGVVLPESSGSPTVSRGEISSP